MVRTTDDAAAGGADGVKQNDDGSAAAVSSFTGPVRLDAALQAETGKAAGKQSMSPGNRFLPFLGKV